MVGPCMMESGTGQKKLPKQVEVQYKRRLAIGG